MLWTDETPTMISPRSTHRPAQTLVTSQLRPKWEWRYAWQIACRATRTRERHSPINVSIVRPSVPTISTRTRFSGNSTFLAFASRIVLATSGVTSPNMAPGSTMFNEATMTSAVGTSLEIASAPEATCSAPASLIALAAATLVPNAIIWQSRCKVSRSPDTSREPKPPPRPSMTHTRMPLDQSSAGGGHGQFAVLDAFHTHKSIGHFSYFRALPLHDQHLKTMVMIEMHMHARQNLLMVVVLNICQFTGQVPHMMVIYERDRADRFFILIPLLADQVIADEIAQRFRSVGVFPPFDMAVECIQQMVIEGHPEAHQL